MSTGPTNPAGQAGDPQIAALVREVDALEAALRNGRLIRVGLIALLVIFTLGMTWRFVALARELRSDQNLQVLTKLGEKQFERRLPLIRKELQVLVDQSSPVVAQAFYAEAKRNLPEYLEAVEQQREPLAESLKEKLHDRLVDAYERALHEKIAMLGEAIPEATEPVVQERVEAHFNATFARLVDKYYIEQLASQLETMFAMWDAFPAEQHHVDDPPLPDLVIGHLLEMASAKLSTSDVRTMKLSAVTSREPGNNSQPAATEPGSTEPSDTVPGATASSVTGPATTEPDTTEPEGEMP